MAAGRRTIAVVEDEETIREGICHALRRDGHLAEPYDDGLTAWEAFSGFVRDRTIDSHVKRIRRKFIAVDPTFSAIERVAARR